MKTIITAALLALSVSASSGTYDQVLKGVVEYDNEIIYSDQVYSEGKIYSTLFKQYPDGVNLPSVGTTIFFGECIVNVTLTDLNMVFRSYVYEDLSWTDLLEDKKCNTKPFDTSATDKLLSQVYDKQYTVLEGDTIFEIMRVTGVYWKDVIKFNNIQPPYSLKVGDKVKLTGEK